MEDRIKKLEDRLDQLENRRIFQQMIVPDAIKMRHMGEANRFFRSGLSADRPTVGETGTDSSAAYFATDTGVLSVWDGSAWLETTLS